MIGKEKKSTPNNNISGKCVSNEIFQKRGVGSNPPAENKSPGAPGSNKKNTN